jgi:hypothetical protein
LRKSLLNSQMRVSDMQKMDHLNSNLYRTWKWERPWVWPTWNQESDSKSQKLVKEKLWNKSGSRKMAIIIRGLLRNPWMKIRQIWRHSRPTQIWRSIRKRLLTNTKRESILTSNRLRAIRSPKERTLPQRE